MKYVQKQEKKLADQEKKKKKEMEHKKDGHNQKIEK
jgi:hypothetical protein